MYRITFLSAAALILLIAGAEATQQGQTAIALWKLMDVCARQAQTAYPDYNPESNAKRDAKLKACLNANNLPPREPMAQPGPR
jgi:hypothetical protein